MGCSESSLVVQPVLGQAVGRFVLLPGAWKGTTVNLPCTILYICMYQIVVQNAEQNAIGSSRLAVKTSVRTSETMICYWTHCYWPLIRPNERKSCAKVVLNVEL